MSRKSNRPSERPSRSFHMIPRRRASQPQNIPAPAARLPDPAEEPHSTLASQIDALSEDTSSLSSVPTTESETPISVETQDSTPTNPKKRKASLLDEPESETSAAELLVYFASSSYAATPESSRDISISYESPQPNVDTPPTSTQTDLSPPRDLPDASKPVKPPPGRLCKKAKPRSDDKYKPSLTHEEWKSKRYWPLFNDRKKVYYGADGETRYKPGSQRPSQRDSPATGSPRRPARGGRGGRGRGGFANGNGRGRPKGRGRGGRDGKDDSPEPPEKQVLSVEEQEMVRRLKARQQELKKIFSTLGAQQVEVLDTLATRDINRLCRKPKSHKLVPEYDEVVEELEDRRDEVEDHVRGRYDYFVQQEHERVARERELIEVQYQQRVEQVKEEHLEGCSGDITLLKKAHARDEDEDRTESGSERDFLPFHHELPESNTHARGYLSRAVQDDKSMREYHESQDDHVRQEVIQEEIKPLLDLITKAKKKRQAEIDREKTQNMGALADEAAHRLQMEDIGGYLIPRPLAGHESHAYGLSALADVASFVAQQHPQQNYIFMPLSPDHRFPRNALTFDPMPGQRPLAPAVPAAQVTQAAPAPLNIASAPAPVRKPTETTNSHTRRSSKQIQASVQSTLQPQPQLQAAPLQATQVRQQLQSSQQSQQSQQVQPLPHSQPQFIAQSQTQQVSSQHVSVQQVPAQQGAGQQMSNQQMSAQQVSAQPIPPSQMPPHTLQSPIQPVLPPRMSRHFQTPLMQSHPQHSTSPRSASHHSPTQMGHQHRPSLKVQTHSNGVSQTHSRQGSLSTPATPHVMSTGPGQPIAPAPPRHTPISVPPSPFRRPSDPPPAAFRYTPVRPAPSTLAPQLTPSGSPRSFFPPSSYPQPPRPPPTIQQFIFQPPQQPPQHHTAPPPASLSSAWVPRYAVPANPNSSNPNISSITTVGAGMGHTGKIPVTFVNQTVASRKAAAAAAQARRGSRVDLGGKEAKDSASASVSSSERGAGSAEADSEGSRPSSAAGIGKEREKEKLGPERASSGGKGNAGGGVRMLLPKV